MTSVVGNVEDGLDAVWLVAEVGKHLLTADVGVIAVSMLGFRDRGGPINEPMRKIIWGVFRLDDLLVFTKACGLDSWIFRDTFGLVGNTWHIVVLLAL